MAYIIIDHNDGGPAVITVTMTVESGAPSGVDTPDRFALTGNYPNPFNPSTEIAFSMSADGPATLEIIDVRGSLVQTIDLGDLTAGAHTINWNGKDNNGRNVASGTYFARLRAADNEATHKMMLAK
ncbi:MAG: T9SS type A sorting domain-containing protein [bacterium]|nr:T9SS type A sorting domain-containing protein [bacterium]